MTDFYKILKDTRIQRGIELEEIQKPILEKYETKQYDALDLPASPRLPLDESAKLLKGAGVKL